MLRGAFVMAKRRNISTAVIGLTVVGLGMSLPELIVSLETALDGKPDLEVGNVSGSNIANILLILGVGVVIFPLTCDPSAIRRDGIAMVVATALCVSLTLLGVVWLWDGVAMVVALVTCLSWSYKQDKMARNAATILHEHKAADLPESAKNIVENIVYIVLVLDRLNRSGPLVNRRGNAHRTRLWYPRIDHWADDVCSGKVFAETICDCHRHFTPP